jgi:hypothetical protein
MKTFNPKKHNKDRRSRPKYKEGEIPQGKWIVKNGKSIQVFPPNPKGKNRAERRKENAINRK